MNKENVLVSVYCLTYNHEKYIKNALEGFVNQKTNFKYEVIVHDDASKDGTANIVREYAEKYPDIIKPILQTENKYSQKINILRTFITPEVRGKYLAICEGDDYWCSCDKLQKQVDFLESHPEYSACAHNTKLYDMKTDEERIMYGAEDKIIRLEDVIFQGGTAYHTSSIMYKTEYLFNRPAYLDSIRGVGDYPLAIFLTTQGKIKYFSDVMSVYRFNVPGSWTARQNRNQTITLYAQKIKMLTAAKEANDKKYYQLFDEAIDQYTYEWRKSTGDYAVLKEERYRKYYHNEPFSSKVKLVIKQYFGFVDKIYRAIKKEQ